MSTFWRYLTNLNILHVQIVFHFFFCRLSQTYARWLVWLVSWLVWLVDYYPSGYIQCSSSVSVQELRKACDYLLLQFDAHTVKCLYSITKKGLLSLYIYSFPFSLGWNTQFLRGGWSFYSSLHDLLLLVQYISRIWHKSR